MNSTALSLGILTTCLAIGVMLIPARRRVRPTTLWEPYLWCWVSWVAFVVVETIVLLQSPAESTAWQLRYLAATLTFCPWMAVLGAKRPQHRGWQFVVASLLAVLWMPAGEAILLTPESIPTVSGARAGFALLLVAVGSCQWIVTRYWPQSLLLAAAQVLLLEPYLGWFGLPATRWLVLVPLLLLALALLLLSAGWPGRREVECRLDRGWLEFRDRFGLLWGLRVRERFNAAADQYNWTLWLSWQGLAPRSSEELPENADPHQQRAMQQVLDNLVGRFVAAEELGGERGDPVVISDAGATPDRPAGKGPA